MSIAREPVATSSELLGVAESIASEWAAVDAGGHFLARNIDTGEELGFDVDALIPIASVAKVPIALVVLDAVARGQLAPQTPVEIEPEHSADGLAGTSCLAHGARLALADLVMLMITVSDNAAADALLAIVGLDAVARSLAEWECPGVAVRHEIGRLHASAVRAAAGDPHLALELAIASAESAPPAIPTLDVELGNVASARGLVALLARVWLDRIATPAATAELRRLMGMQVYHHRLSADLRSDAIRVSGKTGSHLNLRHEIGVVESDQGDRVAIAALTRSSRRATIAHDIDLAIGAAARSAFEALRR